jgi:1,4-dihydroxy-2-naphthoyl-CoA hydrolase
VTAPAPELPEFNSKIADSMVALSSHVGGLPNYLGFRLDLFESGRLLASMDVREELLSPMGTLHGGVMAGFVDHVLGCVLYPHM